VGLGVLRRLKRKVFALESMAESNVAESDEFGERGFLVMSKAFRRTA
jgi:hypothetical protein